MSTFRRNRRPYDLTERNVSGCGLSGVLNLKGKRTDGRLIKESIALLHDRSNGLGGGFAAYGIYPELPEHYALHVMYYSVDARRSAEELMRQECNVEREEKIPTRPTPEIVDPPLLWRYFVQPDAARMLEKQAESEQDFMLDMIMQINADIEGAYIFSSGKNMGSFKAVGFAENVADFFRIEEYEAYLWIAHGRFPTNTPGWWAGAHPFTLLDWAVVHNGEISSYGINKRYLEQFGYQCTMRTDTEVMAYLLDLLIRRHRLPIPIVCQILAAPFWQEIDRLPEPKRHLYKTLRQVYAGALVNGPFAIIFAHNDGMVGLNDRIKLRPLVAARKDENLYLSSEEASILAMCPKPDLIWSPRGGEAIIGTVGSMEVIGQPLQETDDGAVGAFASDHPGSMS